MKTEARQILGKTIAGVIINYAEPNHFSPQSQLWLMFSDNSCYEFYCAQDEIRTTAVICDGGEQNIMQYMHEGYYVAFQATMDSITGQTNYASHER